MALVDLLTSSTARQALARRDIAEVFRILRDGGVSQARIALATGLNRSEIIRSGRQVQSIVLLERIADGLGVPRGWMGMAYEPDLAPTQEDPQTENTADENLLRHAAIVLRGKRQHHVRSMDCAGEAGEMLRAVVSLGHLGRLELNISQPNEALKLFQLSHIEGCTYYALGRFDRAARALSAATDGAGHAVVCTVHNASLLATAQLRSGEIGSGLLTARRVIKLAKDLRSVSMLDDLASLQKAAAARRDSACQDLAREVAILRHAA